MSWQAFEGGSLVINTVLYLVGLAVGASFVVQWWFWYKWYATNYVSMNWLIPLPRFPVPRLVFTWLFRVSSNIASLGSTHGLMMYVNTWLWSLFSLICHGLIFRLGGFGVLTGCEQLSMWLMFLGPVSCVWL